MTIGIQHDNFEVKIYFGLKIKRVIKDEELRLNLIASGRKNVSDNFSQKKQLEEISKFYKEVDCCLR